MDSKIFSYLEILNLASGLSLLLIMASSYLALIFKVGQIRDLQLIAFYFGITAALFYVLRWTSLYHSIKPNFPVSFLFTIGNIVFMRAWILVGIAIDLEDNRDGFDPMVPLRLLMSVGIGFLFLGLVTSIFSIYKRNFLDR
jgi:hypothetical protein